MFSDRFLFVVLFLAPFSLFCCLVFRVLMCWFFDSMSVAGLLFLFCFLFRFWSAYCFVFISMHCCILLFFELFVLTSMNVFVLCSFVCRLLGCAVVRLYCLVVRVGACFAGLCCLRFLCVVLLLFILLC